MDKLKRKRIPDKETSKILNEILEEDRANKEDEDDDDDDDGDNDTDEAEPWAGDLAKEEAIVKKKLCECVRIAENSSRFSLRVMEAMRWLQEAEDTLIPTSTAEDIVDYIQENYSDDGDLYAQVRTALKQTSERLLSENSALIIQNNHLLSNPYVRFVMELEADEYHFVGPDAISMNQFTCTNERMDCSLSLPIKRPRHRKRRTHKDDDCDCNAPVEEEGRNTRRVSQNRGNDVIDEETPDHSYSGTLTDDECVCEDEVQQGHAKNTLRRDRTSRDLHNNGDSRVQEGRQMGMAGEHPLGASGRQENGRRRRGAMDTIHRRTNGNNEEEDGAISQAVNDIYRELENENPGRSRNDEKELKEWIKRCQEECKHRSKRREMDN